MSDAASNALWSAPALLAAALSAVAQIAARAMGQEHAQELREKGQAGLGMRTWLENPLRFLMSALLARLGGLSLALVLLGLWALGWGGLVGALSVVMSTLVVHLVLVEVLLCTYVKHHARALAGPMLAAYAPVDLLLWLPSTLLAWLAARVAGLLTGGDAKAVRAGPFLTEEDMERLWGLAPAAGQPELHEHRLLQGVLDASEAVVRDVMIPRGRVVFVDVESSQEELLKSFAQYAHTRLLVCQGTLDKVLGVLFLTDLVRSRTAGTPFNIKALMRRPYFVPEFMKVMDLLREFQRRRTHLAVVVDEFGTTSGLVTLQDVVEEIVGDVRDEDEVPDATVREVRPGVWLMDARTPVDSAGEVLGMELPANGSYETLGGYLITQAGRLPSPGMVLRRDGLVWTIKDADERRIIRVQVERDVRPEGSESRAADERPDPDHPHHE